MTCLTHEDLLPLIVTAAVVLLAAIATVMLLALVLALAVRHLWPRPCSCRRRRRTTTEGN